MMKFLWPSRNGHQRQDREKHRYGDLPKAYTSVAWRTSSVVPGARFAVHRPSLGQRIALVQKTRELTLQNEFLRAGEAHDQMTAALGELYAERLYLEWGFIEMTGFTIDGDAPTAALLIDKGPQALCQEIVEAIQSEMSLSEDERKNS